MAPSRPKDLAVQIGKREMRGKRGCCSADRRIQAKPEADAQTVTLPLPPPATVQTNI